jgi:TonB-linked SusC/RagA family outer membrane protein
MKRSLLMSLVLILTLFQTVLAQTRTVSGRVIDQKTGEGLPGATVLLKGTTTGISTGADGRFSLAVPETGGTLTISSVGMTTQEVALGSRSTVDVSLATDSKQLTEVVITGYGQQMERRDITGGVVSIKGSEFQNQPVIGADQALQGRAAGVQVTQSSGTPGSGVAVRVRGPGSISASNEPLYVVDGLPINTGSYSQLGVGNQQTNALSDLNPNDIASIEVLKEASAAAIYGSRATNGVVLITTKRGRAGKTQVSLDYYTGIQKAWKMPKALTGPQQVELFIDQVRNRYPTTAAGNITAFGFANWRSYADLAAYTFSNPRTSTVGGVTSVIDDNTGVRDLRFFQDPSTAPSTNWADEIFRTAPISNYGLTFTGGTDRTRFRVSTNYFDQQGTIIGSGYKRASARLSLDNNLSDKVRMGTSIGLSRGTNIRIQNDNNINGVLSAAVLVASDIPVYRPDGTYAKDPGGSTENPVVAGTEPYIRSVSDRLIGSYYAEFELIKNLKYRATFGLDYLALNDQRFLPTTTNTGAGVNGQATEANSTDINFNHISSLNYSHTFNEAHTVSALLVAEYQQDNYHDSFEQATGFPSNAIRQLSAGATKVEATSTATSWNFFGTLAKVTYNFKDRYLLDASVRRDGSSRFGANNRYGYFPAVSAGWRIAQENFMKDQTAVSELKLRASYGQTGNSFIPNFSSRGLISPGYNYLGLGGLIVSQLANPDLRWERTEGYNLGLDVGFLQNRLYLSGDVYIRKTTDLLLNQPLPSDTGFLSFQSNIGSLENKGVELALTTINMRSDDPRGFNWETNINWTLNRNKITQLVAPENNPIGAGFASRIQVGQPLGAFFGYRMDGIFQTQDEIAVLNANAAAKNGAGVIYQNPTTAPGDVRFRDLDGDGRITGADQEIIGNAQPKYYGGITNTLRYMGIDFTVLFQYNVGNQIYNNNISFAQGMNTVFGQDAAVLNRWTTTNTNTNIPRAIYGDPSNNRRISDRFIEDGSYGRIKLVTLGYTLPQALTQKAHISTARIYVQAQNLVTFTKYSGFDPEVNTFSGTNQAANAAPGTDFLTYPQSRTLTAGVTLGF